MEVGYDLFFAYYLPGNKLGRQVSIVIVVPDTIIIMARHRSPYVIEEGRDLS